jgi:hypothetical protein
LVEGCTERAATAAVVANPPLVEMKNLAWPTVAKILLPAAIES